MKEKIKIGQKFENLTIIREDGYNISPSGVKNKAWFVKCECKNEFSILQNSLLYKNTKQCKNCAPKSKILKNTVNNSIWGSIIGHTKLKNLQLPKKITRKYLYNLYIKQNKKCALSGQDIYLSASKKDKKENTASVDRIDSSKGYIPNNIQWVHKKINLMKWDFPQDYFIELCGLIAEHNK